VSRASIATLIAGSILMWTCSAFLSAAQDSRIKVLPVTDRHNIRFFPLLVNGELFKKRVLALTRDDNGFVWIGTDDGLYRYDGYTLRPYRHDPNNPNSLSDNTVMTVFKDRTGNLWVGTGFGGLNRFDTATEAFTHYRHDASDNRTLSDDHVFSVYQDLSGALWIGTDGGLNRLDTATGHFVRYLLDPQGNPRSAIIWGIYEDGQRLLLSTDLGLYKLQGPGGRVLPFSNSSNVSSGPGSLPFGWRPRVRARSGLLWVRPAMERSYRPSMFTLANRTATRSTLGRPRV